MRCPTNWCGSILLESGIFISHIVWLVRTRKIRKEAKAEGKTFDDIMAEHEDQGIPFKFAERKSRKEIKEKQSDVEIGTSRPDEGSDDQTQQHSVVGTSPEGDLKDAS